MTDSIRPATPGREVYLTDSAVVGEARSPRPMCGVERVHGLPFWEPEAVEAEMPIRLGETWGDKFADKLPTWLWSKVRIAYYIFSLGLLAVTSIGSVVLFCSAPWDAAAQV